MHYQRPQWVKADADTQLFAVAQAHFLIAVRLRMRMVMASDVRYHNIIQLQLNGIMSQVV